jgi:hypothetical protein
VFDICYHNTSEIAPTTITGDMHSVNKANFAILHWFGLNLAPRFTNLQAQLKHLYCGRDVAEYRDCLIRPAGRIDHQLVPVKDPKVLWARLTETKIRPIRIGAKTIRC